MRTRAAELDAALQHDVGAELHVVAEDHVGPDDRVGADAHARAPGGRPGSTTAVGWIASLTLAHAAGSLSPSFAARRSSRCSSARTPAATRAVAPAATAMRGPARSASPACPITAAPACDVARDPALGADDGPVADGDVVGDTDLPGQHHAAAEPRGARDARPAPPAASSPDLDVVADLHEVVDLGAPPDDGVAERRAVDRGVGADLDVVLDHHAADLGDLPVGAGRRTRSRSRRRPARPRGGRRPGGRARTPSRRLTCGWTIVPSPISTPAPTYTSACRLHTGADDRPRLHYGERPHRRGRIESWPRPPPPRCGRRRPGPKLEDGRAAAGRSTPAGGPRTAGWGPADPPRQRRRGRHRPGRPEPPRGSGRRSGTRSGRGRRCRAAPHP